MDEEAFSVPWLTGRGGFSQVTAFFFADRVVLCDRGPMGALARYHEGAFDADLAASYEAARRIARRVDEVPDREIRQVRVVLRMTRHGLRLARDRGEAVADGYRRVRRAEPETLSLGALDRPSFERAVSLLAARFGPRFELVTTRTYGFIHRVAPLLTR